eukprot:9354377-Alexandrium_andersonii.AAC.1
MLQTCFGTGPASASAHLFHAFSGEVYEERWGTVVHALEALLPLELPLRAAWSMSRYAAGTSDGAEDAAREGREGKAGAVKLAVADSAIGSELFWRYLEAMNFFAEAIRE